MKKTIVFVSIFTIFLMLMIPNVSSLEYNLTETEIREKISEKFEYNEIKIKEKTGLPPYEIIFITFFNLLSIYSIIKSGFITVFLQVIIFGFIGELLAEFLLSQGVNPFVLLVLEIIVMIIVTINKYDLFDFEIGAFLGGMFGVTIASLLDQSNSNHSSNHFQVSY